MGIETLEDLFRLSAQELIDLGFNPFGVQVLKDAVSGLVPEERLLEMLDSVHNRTDEKRLVDFKSHVDKKQELNRKEKRLLAKRYRNQLKRG